MLTFFVLYYSKTLINTVCTHRPSPEEIKRDVLAGKGGLCYTINVFLAWLLEALGYNISYINGLIGDSPGHLVILITDVVTPGDKFLLDCGIGYPTFEVTPLDFEHESEVYCHSFVKYKFIKEDGYVIRCHKRREKSADSLDLPGNLDNSGWKKIMYADITPRTLDYFDDVMESVYGDVECKLTPLNNSLRVVGYNEISLKPVILKDAVLLSEGEDSCLEEARIDSAEEMLELIEKNYPNLKEDSIIALTRLSLF